ncbi:MAG: hypothetical protein ABR521_05065 [Gaiellaceae bacterium]
MVDTYDNVLHELRLLLEASTAGAGAPPLAPLEEALTSGYALALALEGERARLRREIGDLAGAPPAGDDRRLERLLSLSARLGGAQSDLERLRAMLSQLRGRASRLRAEAVA